MGWSQNINFKQCVGLLIVLVLFLSPLVVNAGDVEKSLFEAINRCDVRGVERALQAGADPNARNLQALISFQTPLAFAVDLGEETIVDLLLNSGADVNLRVGFWHDISPLYIAVANGNLTLVKQLLNAGAKIEPNRWTALKEFFTAPWSLLRGEVISLSRPPSLLEAAQKNGNNELYQFLKKRGAR